MVSEVQMIPLVYCDGCAKDVLIISETNPIQPEV